MQLCELLASPEGWKFVGLECLHFFFCVLGGFDINCGVLDGNYTQCAPVILQEYPENIDIFFGSLMLL